MSQGTWRAPSDLAAMLRWPVSAATSLRLFWACSKLGGDFGDLGDLTAICSAATALCEISQRPCGDQRRSGRFCRSQRGRRPVWLGYYVTMKWKSLRGLTLRNYNLMQWNDGLGHFSTGFNCIEYICDWTILHSTNTNNSWCSTLSWCFKYFLVFSRHYFGKCHGKSVGYSVSFLPGFCMKQPGRKSLLLIILPETARTFQLFSF